MAVNLIILFGVLTGLAIGWIIHLILRKKTDEPERDERTEKVACKAVKSTIIILMLVLAIIGWGDVLDLFKLETIVTISLVFFSLMISLILFPIYYNSKEL